MSDLTTLDGVKLYLGIDAGDTGVDGILARLVSSESARFVSLTNNPIVSGSFTETRSGTGSRILVPRNYPIASVQSVAVDGETILQRATQDGTGWVLVSDRIELAGCVFTRGVGNVVITYTAGYASIPLDVDQAVAEMVALKFKGRDRIGLMSQSVGGETLSYQTLTLPESVQSVIDDYSRPVI